MKTKKTAIILLIIALVTGGAMNTSVFASIGQGILHILGIDLSVDPEEQTAPINTGTAINTNVIFPDIDLGDSIPSVPQDLMVVAELTGPGISEPKTISTRAGEQLMIPPLPQEGTYVLDNIRLMSGDQVLLYAEPSMALIDTIEKLLITQVTSRALDIDEIEELGITISPDNFTAYEFTVGFVTESGRVEIKLPVVMDKLEKVSNFGTTAPRKISKSLPSLEVPNLFIEGFKLGLYEEKDIEAEKEAPPIAGIVIIPGNIAFLNQFFEVMLLVTNNAPEGTPLVVTDLTAEISLPAGEDNIPDSIDDPLRIAQREEGTESVVPVINADDKGPDIAAQESGEGKFYIEGLKEGTHLVNIEITGTLLGLPSGPVEVKGTAIGTVLVRNPNFSLTFGHPDVVRAGEEYSLFVTVNNISQVDANLVYLSLPPGSVFGATVITDSDPESENGTVEFRTIKAGDSAVAEFKMIARKTGRVTSTAFHGVEGVQGVFKLRTGVDERGIPLSSESLILSRYIDNLPEDLLYEAIRVLGLAHSVATSPMLPSGVTRISNNVLLQRAYELTEAGLRIEIGESVENSVDDLLMDWLGNGSPDKGFEEVLRNTDAGNDFLSEAGKIIGDTDHMSAQRSFGEVVKYRTPFISAVVDNTGQASAYIEITDSNDRSLGRGDDGSIVREIPYGVLVDLDGEPDIIQSDMALLDSRAGESYELKIKGINQGLINFGLILRDTDGGFVHAIYRDMAINAGETVTGQIISGADAPVLENGSSLIYPAEVYTYPANEGPKVIGAMQLAEADARNRGRVVAILFNEKIDPESANNPANYELLYRNLDKELRNPPKKVKILPGKRIIEVFFQCTISPFFEYDLILSGIKDPDLNTQDPDPARLPVVTTLTDPGGIVSGTVREGNGDPIPHTEVLMREAFTYQGITFLVITNRTITDKEGNYQIDYVAMNSGSSIESSDPQTGQTGRVSPRITMDRQHLKLDILLLGLGEVTGQVIRADDSSPVEYVIIEAKSLNTRKTFKTRSDQNGRFTLRSIPVGNLNVSAEKVLYKGSIAVNIPSAGAVVDVTLPIYDTAISGSIKGRVFESDGITPVSGVPVIVKGDKYNNWQYSDEEGFYFFEDVADESVLLYTFRQETGEEAEAESAVSTGMTTTVNLVFPGTSTIVGTVTYSNGEPARARILAGVNLVDTDENGNFIIDKVPIGSIEVKAADEYGKGDTVAVDIGSPGETVRVNIVIKKESIGTIQGYVKSADGQPLPYQRVIMKHRYGYEYALADSNGFFKKELPLGNCSVRIVNNSRTDGEEKKVVLALDGQTVTVDLQFKGFGTITGTVYQPDGVSPTVASVYISKIIYTDKGAPGKERVRYISDQLTDEGLTGKFVIENVRVGDFRLSASNDFYFKPSVAIGIINYPGETVNVDIVLNSTSSVRGQVYLANGNKAGAGLPVTITPQDSAAKMQVLTGSGGTFEFDLVPSERFTLDVYDPLTGNRGIARGSVETGDEAVVDVHLFGQGTVNVKVINGGGDPVPDAKVNLNSGSDIAYLINSFPVILTDVNGEAVFYNVPEGEFSVTAKDPITLSGGKSGGTIPEDLTEVNVTIIVSASGSVEGIVYSPDGTETVPYAQVKIDMPGKPAFYATSDEEGKFIFAFVPLGKFDVDVFHPRTGRVGKSQGRINYDTQVVTVDVRLIAQGTVEGYVFTASGEIVTGAGIEISGEHLTGANVIVTTSNLDGMFMVSGIPEGSFTVKAIDDIKDISGEAYGEISYEGEVVRSHVYLEATGTIEGKVLAANTVTPAPYAEVSLKGDGYNGYTSSTVTDSEGNFSFTSIPLGIYELTALEQSGFDGGQSAVAIEYEGESRQVDIIFIGTGNIEGRVVMDDGTPPDMETILTLKRTGLFNGEFTAYSDLDGNFTFYGIPTGEFSISAEIPGSYLGGAYTGSLDEDGMTLSDVSIVIESAGEIHGSIFREDGSTLVKDALVTCSVVTPDNRRFEVYAASDENGEFTLSGVPLGDFTLFIIDFYAGGSGKVSGILTETDRVVNAGSVVLDERPPGVVSITPASGSIQVPRDSLITVTFSEPVDPGSINTNNIKVSDGSSSISGSLSLSDDRQTVTFTPDAELSEFTPITVTVRFIRDDMWKYMRGMEVSTFTTADITPPRVLAARLINGAFVAEFSEPVVGGSGLFEVNFTGTGQPVEGNLTFSASDTVATLYPPAPLPDDTGFDLTISGYTDSFGNIQTDEFSATYMTGDEIEPSITLTSSTPSVIEGTPVIVKAIPVDSPDLFVVDYRISGILVESVNREPFAMTIIPIETVTVTAIPTDYAGNMGEEVSITVDVIPNAPPASVILSPEDGYLAGTGKSVKIRAGASDDLGLKEIEMKVSSPVISMTQVYKVSSDVLSDTHDFYFNVPSTSAPGNEILVKVIARDSRGLESLPAEIVLTTEDTTRPAAQITSFTKGFNVAPGDTIPVTVYASDNSAVSRIDFVTEGGLQISEYQDIKPPSYDAIAFFSLAIPADYSGGTKVTVAPFATDVSGNVGYAPRITLIVDDIIPPAVEILTPSDGSSVMARDTVKISVGASDNDAIDRVEFFIDGQLFATDRYAYGDLYDATFKAPAEEGASVTLSAVAYDKFENSAESTEITVNVVKDNIQPEVAMLSNLAAIKFGEGHVVDIRIRATDNIGISSAELLVNNNIVSTFENPGSTYLTFHYPVEALIPVGSDSIIVPLEVRAANLDGNTGTSGVYDIEIIRDNAPAVSIISPQSGRNVLGGATIHIEAEASDDFGIGSIEIKVNGATLAADTGAAITADYDVPETALGSVINIEAVAVDTMGNSDTHNIDVNVPLSVSQASVLSTGKEIIGSTIYNGYVYIFEKGAGVSVVDVSDVSSPNVIASLPIQGYYKGIDAYEGVIYVFGASGITLIDTADPYNPGILYSTTTPGPVSDIAFRSGYAYAAMDSEGLLVLDVHDTGSPVSITYNIANVKDVDTEGDYLYISHGSSSPYLEVYSLADPVNPAALDAHNTGPVNSYDSEGDTGIGVTGNNKLASFGYDEASGLRQFTDIVLKGSSSVNTVDLTGQYAIHASGAESWGIVEVAETGGLSDMGTILTGESIYKTILQGGHVYAADGFAGLRIYRIETLNTLSPEVSITSPVSGSSIQEGTEVEVSADVINGDNALVTFYIDGKEVFTDEATPYGYRFRVPKDITTISIKARAQNLNGLTAESPEITLNVVEENEPPVITITSPPQDGTTPTLVEGNTLYVSGSAEDNYGIDRIDLLIDGSVVDSTLLPAFDLEYYIPDDGLEGTGYQIGVVVRAADVSGNISEAAFNVNVVEDNPPVITFITPQPSAELYGGLFISFNVSAVDDSAIEEVNFYEDGVLLGAGTSTSGNVYTMLYRTPDVSEEETRIIKAEAIDSAGQTSMAETSIIIKPSQTGVIVSVGDDAATLDIQDNIAVTGGSNGIMNVYNIGVPTSPVLVGSLNLGQEIRQLRIKGDKVYAASGSYMRIIDISDPANPVQLSATILGTLNTVDVYDGIVFVGYSSYIYIYDARDAESPGYVTYKYVGAGAIQDIMVDGPAGLLYAIVNNGNSSYLSVFDINDINKLVEIGRVTVPGNPRRIEIKGDKAFIANTIGMVIVDITDPAETSIIGNIDTPGTGADIEVLGNQAFIADGSTYGLTIVDITNPLVLLHETSIETPGIAKEVVLSQGLAFIADGTAGLTVVEVGDTPPFVRTDLISITNVKIDGTADIIGLPMAVTDEEITVQIKITNLNTGAVVTTDIASGSDFTITVYASIADEFDLEVFDSYQSSGPVYLGRVPVGEVVGGYPVSGYARTIDVKGNIVVTGEKGGLLSVFDITDPLDPLKAGSLNLGQEIRQLRIKGDKVYAASGSYMKIIDISDPANPVQLSATILGTLNTVDVHDGIVFVGYSSYIYIYDARDAESPGYVTYKYVGAGAIQDIMVDGPAGLLYAIVNNGNSSYLSVFDINDINKLVEIGRVTVPGNPRRMEIAGDEVYIAARSGMVIVSLSRLGSDDFGTDVNGDGRADDILSYITTTGSATDVDIKGNYAYLADGMFNGIKVIDITDTSDPYEAGEIDTPGDAVELEISGIYAYVADGGKGLKVVWLYTAETVPDLELDLVSMNVDPVTTTMEVVGSPGAVYDNVYPVIVRIERTMTSDVYETQVQETDNGAFAITLPWVPGDELYISLEETTPNPVIAGPVYLGRVPAGEVVGGHPVAGYARTIDVQGNIVVTGEKGGLLSVFDITDPLNPLKAGSLNLGQEIRQLRIKGDKVYAASGSYMKIIDISDPANPVQLSATILGTLNTVDVHDGIVFVGYSSYIYIYDARDAESPGYVTYKYVGAGAIQDIMVDGPAGLLYAIVNNGNSSYLAVFDINDINKLVEIGRVTVPGNPRRMEIAGDEVYIAARSGMVIVSLSRLGSDDFGTDVDGDGRADDILSYITTTGSATDVDIKGNYAYLADGMFNGIKVIDVTDPGAPYEIADIHTPGDAVELEISGIYAYVADGGKGLKVVQLYTAETVPDLEIDLVSMNVDPVTTTMEVVGSPGAVYDNVYPVIVRIERTMTSDVYETQVQETDNGAFAITLPWVPGDELYISLEETTPNPVIAGPVYLGRVPAGEVVGGHPVAGYARTIDVRGNIAAVGDKDGVLSVFDISDPLDPLKLSSLDIGTEIKQVRIKGDKVYAVSGSYMKIIDISDPANPVQLSATILGTLNTVDVYDGIVFVGYSSYIYIYDARDAESPGYVTYKYVGAGTIQDIMVDGPAGLLYAIVNNGNSSYLAVFDVNDINKLVEIGRVMIPGNPRRMEIAGDEVYIAARSGMVIVSLSRLGSAEFGNDGDSNGTADDVLSYIQTTGGATDVDIRGDYAYLADGMFNGIKMIDITDPGAPYEIANIHTPGDAIELEIRGEYAYIADEDAGLSIAQLYTAW